MQIIRHLATSLLDSARDLLPIIIVIAFFQVVVLQQPIPNMGELLFGTILVIFGLTFFIHGLKIGLFPLGESMAWDFAKKGSLFWLLLFAFALGFGTTIAEPALIKITKEAAIIAANGGMINQDTVSQDNYANGLRFTVALSVGFAILLGVLRIIRGWPVQYLIVGGYIGVVIMTAFAPKEIQTMEAYIQMAQES